MCVSSVWCDTTAEPSPALASAVRCADVSAPCDTDGERRADGGAAGAQCQDRRAGGLAQPDLHWMTKLNHDCTSCTLGASKLHSPLHARPADRPTVQCHLRCQPLLIVQHPVVPGRGRQGGAALRDGPAASACTRQSDEAAAERARGPQLTGGCVRACGYVCVRAWMRRWWRLPHRPPAASCNRHPLAPHACQPQDHEGFTPLMAPLLRWDVRSGLIVQATIDALI